MCSLISALRRDQYKDLRPHPDYIFKNGDLVVYDEYIEDVFIREVYCELEYDFEIYGFILIKYTSNTYEEISLDENKDVEYEYLSDVGIDKIRLLEEGREEDDELEDE